MVLEKLYLSLNPLRLRKPLKIWLPKVQGVAVNRESIREYAVRQRERYVQADRRERSRMLDEVVAVTGYQRKAAVRTPVEVMQRPSQ